MEKALPWVLGGLHTVFSAFLSHEKVALVPISGLETFSLFLAAGGAALGTLVGARTYDRKWWLAIVTFIGAIPAWIFYAAFLDTSPGVPPWRLVWPCILYSYMYFAAFHLLFC